MLANLLTKGFVSLSYMHIQLESTLEWVGSEEARQIHTWSHEGGRGGRLTQGVDGSARVFTLVFISQTQDSQCSYTTVLVIC